MNLYRKTDVNCRSSVAKPGGIWHRLCFPGMFCFAALLFFLTGSEVAAGAFETIQERTQRLRLHGLPDMLTSARPFARQCSRAVARFLGQRETPEAWIDIYLFLDKLPAGVSPGALTVLVRQDAVISSALHEISLACLRRSLPADVPETHLHWLAAAVVFQVLEGGGDSVFARFDYQALRHNFRAGVFPAMTRLIEAPVTPEADMLYALYSMHAHLLATIMFSSGPRQPNPLFSLFSLIAAKEDLNAALNTLLQDQFSGTETVQEWYERQAAVYSRSGRGKSSADEILDRLRQVLIISVTAPGADGRLGVRNLPLRELRTELKHLKLPSANFVHIEAEIFDLAKDAPPLLRQPLLEYMTAVKFLREGQNRRFERQLKRAEQLLGDAVGRQRQITEHLDSIETGRGYNSGILDEYLRLQRKYRSQVRELFPEMHEKLDTLEK